MFVIEGMRDMLTARFAAPLLALALAGCTLSPGQSPAPPTDASPTPAAAAPTESQPLQATSRPSDAPMPTSERTISPTQQPTAELTPAVELPDPTEPPNSTAWVPTEDARAGAINWQRIETTGLDMAVSLTGIATFRGQFVLTGAVGHVDDFYLGPAVWLSMDGASWRNARIENRPVEVGFGAPFVVGERVVTNGDGSIWTSGSGDDWRRLDSAAVGIGSVHQLAAAGGRLLAFGGSGADWDSPQVGAYSDDGLAWTVLADETALHIVRGLRDIHTADGEAYAFVASNEQGQFMDWELVDSIEVWRTSDGRAWTLLGELEESRQVADVSGMAVNSHGMVAVSFNERMAWFRTDGSRWQRAAQPPLRRIWPEFLAVGATPDAFVVTSGRYPTDGTGIFHESNVTGLTWLSSDGDSWPLQDDAGWDGREIDLLHVHGDVLVGVGRDFTASELGAIWVSPFPRLDR